MSELPVRAAVIGWPIGHSRSPLMHNYWLAKHAIPARYDKIAVKPEELNNFLNTLPERGMVGCGITIPHKERAFTLIADTDEASRRLKSINTVYLVDGRPHGMSTDGIGFMTHLADMLPGFRPRSVLLLGAGGAARAVAAALLDSGSERILIANRTAERAEQVARELGARTSAISWMAAPERLSEVDLLVNTTSLGMSGQPPLEITLDRLPASAAVADIVYSPLETGLLADARARGHRVVDGLGMLLHQAVPAFEKWFGIRPQVTPELRAILEADLVASRR